MMQSRTPKGLVLAAGQGTRLRPLTLERPKPMLPIHGKPLLAHTLEWLKGYGVREIAINLHHQPHVITGYFGDGAALGVNLTYSREDPLLGTAGAVRKLSHFLDGAPLMLVYGDVLTDLALDELYAFHTRALERDPDTGVTMALYRAPNPTEVGLVDLDEHGRIVRFVEKPRRAEVFTDLANAGILVVEPRVVNRIPPDTFYDFGRDLFPRLLAEGVPLYGWTIPDSAYVLDIGSPEKYAQAQAEWPLRAGQRSRQPCDG